MNYLICHAGCDRVNQLHLVLTVSCSSNDDVLQRLVWVHAKALSDALDSLWAERSLCINVRDPATAASLTDGDLSNDLQKGLDKRNNRTESVWQICVFPVRNSPKASVMLAELIPPPISLSSSLDPVESLITFNRF
jgi:hypothetical protein